MTMWLRVIHRCRQLSVAVQVDGHFKTNVDGVYAIGDCIPGPMLAHKAEEDGYVLAEMLAGKPGHVDYNTVPSIVYTDPEVRSSEGQHYDIAVQSPRQELG